MTIGNTAWPHLLADLEAKRDALTHMIDNIRTHFVNAADPSTMPESPVQVEFHRPARVSRKHKSRSSGKKKSGLKGRRTDGRTDGARTAPARSAEPP